MATVTLSSPACYRNGLSGATRVVGVESTYNRVIRYSFQSPATGATSVSLSFSGMQPGNGTRPDTLRFYIGTDPNSHINAGAATACTGLLKVDTGSYTAFTGTADILLQPGTTYYLYVYPDTTAYGWYYWEGSAAMTVSGASCSVPTLSAATVEMAGGKVTIYTNRSSTDLTHTVSYRFASAVGAVIAENVTDSCTWSPLEFLADHIPNKTSGTAVITCTTYNGTQQVGTPQSVSLTVTVPERFVPTAALSFTDSSGAFGKLGVYVQNVTKLAVTATGKGIHGSTVTGQSVTVNGRPYSGGVLTGSGEQTLTLTVTDSRGRRGTATERLTLSPYAPPKLYLSASRCTADGTADDTGDHARISATCITSAIGGNTAALTLKSGASKQSVTVNTGNAVYSCIVPADTESVLTISATLSDKLLASENSITLSTGYATVDLLKGGRGIAFGAVAASPGFHCAMDATFTHSVRVAETERELEALLEELLAAMPNYSTAPILWKNSAFSWATYCGTLYKYTDDWAMVVGDTYADGASSLPARAKKVKSEGVWSATVADPADCVVAQGTDGIWTWRKWHSGLAECWGFGSGNVAISTAWGALYYQQLPSVQFPAGLFAAAPVLCADLEHANAFLSKNLTTADATGTFYALSAAPVTSSAYKLNLSAKGRWK